MIFFHKNTGNWHWVLEKIILRGLINLPSMVFRIQSKLSKNQYFQNPRGRFRTRDLDTNIIKSVGHLDSRNVL